MSTVLSPEALMARLASGSPPLVIDVRKPEAFRAEPATIPGAIWRDRNPTVRPARARTRIPNAATKTNAKRFMGEGRVPTASKRGT